MNELQEKVLEIAMREAHAVLDEIDAKFDDAGIPSGTLIERVEATLNELEIERETVLDLEGELDFLQDEVGYLEDEIQEEVIRANDFERQLIDAEAELAERA